MIFRDSWCSQERVIRFATPFWQTLLGEGAVMYEAENKPYKAALFLEISGKADSLLDAYSSIRVALALAEAFGCSVNELPLTLVLSWYEQKAVCILLTLLSLGIKNMYLGPTLPAFLSETVVKVLVDTYGLQPITAPEQDMDAILHRG